MREKAREAVVWWRDLSAYMQYKKRITICVM
jgi:hypothetical protein